MESILSLYEEPYDPVRPVVCFDESSKELRKHVRAPLPAAPGAVARTDHHYERNGTRMLYIATEPLTGDRQKVFTNPQFRKLCTMSVNSADSFVAELSANDNLQATVESEGIASAASEAGYNLNADEVRNAIKKHFMDEIPGQGSLDELVQREAGGPTSPSCGGC